MEEKRPPKTARAYKVDEWNGDGMVCHFRKYSAFVFEKRKKGKQGKGKRERVGGGEHMRGGGRNERKCKRNAPRTCASPLTRFHSPVLFLFFSTFWFLRWCTP